MSANEKTSISSKSSSSLKSLDAFSPPQSPQTLMTDREYCNSVSIISIK